MKGHDGTFLSSFHSTELFKSAPTATANKTAMTEKLCLQWKDFTEIVKTAFGNLKEDTDFTDVTLFCEDGQWLDAHRVILASSSAFFKDLLLKINQPHPVIFMRALTHATLATMMNFIYLGEAEVRKEKLDDFLSLAGELGVKGMTNTVPNPIQECMRYHELFLMPFIRQFFSYPLSGTAVEILYSFSSLKLSLNL